MACYMHYLEGEQMLNLLTFWTVWLRSGLVHLTKRENPAKNPIFKFVGPFVAPVHISSKMYTLQT